MKTKILSICLISLMAMSSLQAAQKSNGYSLNDEQRKIKRALMSLNLQKNQQDGLYNAETALENELDTITQNAKNSPDSKLSTYFEPNSFNRTGFFNMIDNRQEKSKQALQRYVDSLYRILDNNQLAEFRRVLKSQE